MRSAIASPCMECWSGSIRRACKLLREGLELVDDPRLQLIALHGLAERFARDGDGWSALQLLSVAFLPLKLSEAQRFETRHTWITGIALRALGQHDQALDKLRGVVHALQREGTPVTAAFASLDLACVLLAKGDTVEAMKLASAAWETFLDEDVDAPLIAALLVLNRSIHQRTATESLAVQVANFMGRYRQDRSARFDPSDAT